MAAPTLPLPVATAQVVATLGAAALHSGLGDFVFVDALHGWYRYDYCADGQYGNAGNCAPPLGATTDGGQSWRIVGTVPQKATRIGFTNAREGWAYGPGLYLTGDGGLTWQEAQSLEPRGGGGYEVVSATRLGNNLLALMRSCLPDPVQQGVACTLLPRASTDGGTTWRDVQGLPALQAQGGQLGSMSLVPGSSSSTGQEGWLITWSAEVVAQDGKVTTPSSLFITRDAGLNWHEQSNPPCAAEYSPTTLLAADRRKGLWLACGGQPGAGFQPKSVHRSPDEGKHWQLVSESKLGNGPKQGASGIGGGGYLSSLAVAAPEHAFVALQRGTLIETTDGGAKWSTAIPMPGDGSVGKVEFVDEQHGWWVTLGNFFRTTDGGKHWDELPHP